MEKKVYYGSKRIGDVMRYFVGAKEKGRMRKMLNSFDHDTWYVYGDRTSTDCIISGRELTNEGYVLVGTVEYTTTESTILAIRELVAQWKEDLYCCKKTALSLTHDSEILNKAWIKEAKNPYHSSWNPMQLYNKQYILYLMEHKAS